MSYNVEKSVILDNEPALLLIRCVSNGYQMPREQSLGCLSDSDRRPNDCSLGI